MQSAQEQFLLYGLRSTSVDRIAREARVGKNSLYALFPGKDAMLAAVIEQALEKMVDTISHVRIRGNELSTALTHYAQAYIATVVGRGSGLYRVTITAEREFPSLAAQLHQAWIAISGYLISYFEEQITRGRIVQTDPALLAFRFISCAVDGSRYLTGYAKPSDAATRTIARTATALFLDGYGKAPDVAIPHALLPGPGLEAEISARPEARAAIRMPAERMHSLLEAARQEFFDNGFHDANLDRIANGAGVGKATLFRHFATKSGLFRHIVLREAETIWGPPIPVTLGSTIEETLSSLVAGVLDRHLEPPSLALHRLMIAEAGQFPALMTESSELMRSGPAAQLRRYLMMFGWPPAGRFACRTFFTIATDGVRWIGGSEHPDPTARSETVGIAVRTMLTGLRTP